jgi:hypothetical protein
MDDLNLVTLGACRVMYGGVDLGYTMGGVEVEVVTESRNITLDQFGDSTINQSILGRSVRITVPLAETTLDNLVKIMPGATLIGSTSKRVDVSHSSGLSLMDFAQILKLHPQINADDDLNDDFVVPRAVTPGDIQFAYKSDGERVYSISFMGYASPNSDILFYVGDPSAVDLEEGLRSFQPNQALTVRFTATSVSSTAALVWSLAVVRLWNRGPDTIYIDFGDASVTADEDSSMPLPADHIALFGVPAGATHIAMVTAGVNSVLYKTPGRGIT